MKEIKTWGERAAEKFQADQILYEEAKQQTVIDCMRAEISELRAFLEKLSTEPVAEYDGVEFSRHTIRWTSGPMPVGTKLYAAPAIQQPQDKPNADCSGDPKSCPDNEGYGCACDPMNKAASANTASCRDNEGEKA